jgi:hypothetical protein
VQQIIEGNNMCCENGKNEKLTERLLKLMDEIDYLKDDLKTWTDALEELSEIEDAFKTTEKPSEKPEIREKTILDVGTDAVKPLYIALKFKPSKMIGINECFPTFVSDIELKSKILTPTKIRLYTCSLFNKVTLDIIRDKEAIKEFNFVLVSKTLHHLRTGECIASKRDKNHDCKRNESEKETEKDCIYGFETKKIFDRLLELGKRVIVYESFDPNDKDDDKVRGRGGYFTSNELTEMLRILSDKYEVEFIRPERFSLSKRTFNRIGPILRKVDCVCFYVEDLKRNKS